MVKDLLDWRPYGFWWRCLSVKCRIGIKQYAGGESSDCQRRDRTLDVSICVKDDQLVQRSLPGVEEV